MIVRLLRQSLLAAPVLFLAACASTSQLDPNVASSLTSHGVSQGTIEKMTDGDALNYNDILGLVQKGVSSDTVTDYLQSTRKVYNFSYAELQGLKSGGATQQLLNYLTETEGFYGVNTAQQRQRPKGGEMRAYYNTPGHQAQQPFGYNQPLIDGFYNSGYEESLYSPFSFN